MSTVPPCRNGVNCTRPDCWFGHPDGRTNGPPLTAPGGPPMRQYGGGPRSGGPSSGGPSAPSNPGNVCRFGRACHREGCYYSHPDGRELDENAPPSGGISAGPGANAHRNKPQAPISPHSGGHEFDEQDWEEYKAEEDAFIAEQGGLVDVCECCNGKPYECETPSCKAAGKCGCTVEEEEEDDALRDEWFPSHRECPCCEGYIYRCKKQQSDCVSGNCYCSLQKSTTTTNQ